MARSQSALVNWSQYLALRTVCTFLPCFDVEQNLDTAARLGSAYFRLSAGRRARATENLRAAFPHWDDERIADVAERSVRHMLQVFGVDALVMGQLVTPGSWPRRVRIGNLGPTLDRIVRREPIILITGHLGNWELLGHYLAAIGCPITAVARPIDNPLVNAYVLRIREALGTRIVSKWGATDALQQTLDSGGRVGFIADQNAGDQGYFVPFFGRLASNYKSIALLAMRHEVPVSVSAALRRGPGFDYEVVVEDYITPDDWADADDPMFYIVARYNRALERLVRRDPDQFLWVHRRWRSRPKFERAGRPMPARLRGKLEALPWMTDAEMARLTAASAPSAPA